MVNPADILNTSGAGASTNCLSALCWNIRVSNPDVSGIPENATITGARFTLLGTGSGGNLKVTVGRNSTYCRYPATVGDRSTTLKESNDFLTSGLIPFYICDSQDGYPISVDELPNFFLEITAPKNAPFLPFSFINPFIAFDYILPVTPTPTPTITQTPTPTPDPIQVGPKIVSYKITDGFTVDPPGPLGVGRVFFNNSI
ncbi:MAG: hypothetical protein HYV40_05980, partial [Candidatus Levybacteria bacterium]|nr:hypothetical protein [Candidatus Levybacteria bacterium]